MAIARALRVPFSGAFVTLMKEFVNRGKLKDLFVSLREPQAGGVDLGNLDQEGDGEEEERKSMSSEGRTEKVSVFQGGAARW